MPWCWQHWGCLLTPDTLASVKLGVRIKRTYLNTLVYGGGWLSLV